MARRNCHGATAVSRRRRLAGGGGVGWMAAHLADGRGGGALPDGFTDGLAFCTGAIRRLGARAHEQAGEEEEQTPGHGARAAQV